MNKFDERVVEENDGRKGNDVPAFFRQSRLQRAWHSSFMKRPDNTEMDRLLSRFARRNGESVRAGNGQSSDDRDASDGTHLDADELNAYAEGALPESARSRYFAHLADCETCRKLVTQLTLAATLSNEERTQRVAAATASPSKSWRDLLAQLFSPPVLRYGVPALALLAIIVVAIVATRTRKETSFVAEDKEAAQSYPSATTANSNSSAETATTTTTETTDANHANSNSATSNTATSNTASSIPPQNPATQSTPTAGATQEKDKNTDTPTVARTDVAKSTEQPGSDAKQPASGQVSGKVLDETVTVAAAPQPVEAPVFSTSSTAAKEAENKREERKRGQTTENDDQVTSNTTAAGGATTPEPSVNGARDVQSRRAAGTAQNQPATKPAAPPKSEAADTELAATASAAETRSVQGHKFRRQGSIWVDVAYKTSLSTTTVARGSEQYRALVADEPGLRAITQQLGGQVIVVWKGHAYRFY